MLCWLKYLYEPAALNLSWFLKIKTFGCQQVSLIIEMPWAGLVHNLFKGFFWHWQSLCLYLSYMLWFIPFTLCNNSYSKIEMLFKWDFTKFRLFILECYEQISLKTPYFEMKLHQAKLKTPYKLTDFIVSSKSPCNLSVETPKSVQWSKHSRHLKLQCTKLSCKYKSEFLTVVKHLI